MTIENDTMIIEPVERIFDRLAGEMKFNFKSVAAELPRLRKAAEEELLERERIRQISKARGVQEGKARP